MEKFVCIRSFKNKMTGLLVFTKGNIYIGRKSENDYCGELEFQSDIGIYYLNNDKYSNNYHPVISDLMISLKQFRKEKIIKILNKKYE